MTALPHAAGRRVARVAMLTLAASPPSLSAEVGAGDKAATVVNLSHDLPVATAVASPGSKAVHDTASGDPFIRAAVVLERGKLVADYVRDDVDPCLPFQVWSTTKSWTSLLIGIMVDEGLLSINETLGKIFVDHKSAWDDVADADTVDFRRAVTIREMLTMTSGLITPPDLWDKAYDGPDDFDDILTNGGGSSLRDALAYPVLGTKGEFSYLGISNILSYVVRERTGVTPREYLAQKVMAPLGIAEDTYGWRRNEDGVEFAFHGLELTPLQMAKFGQLYLQGGVAGPAVANGKEERRVVSRKWIDDSFAVHSMDDETGDPVGYGYLFWSAGSAFCARGLFGQDICVDRESERVVVQQRDPDYGNLLADDFVVIPVALDPALSFETSSVGGDYPSAALVNVAGGIWTGPMIAAAAALVLSLSVLRCSMKLWGRSRERSGYDAI